MRLSAIAAIAVVSAVGFVQIATAADLPHKAPLPVAPAAAPVWTGFYVGGNLGWGWGHTSTDFSGLELNGTEPIATSGSYSTKTRGPVGGLQLGYNLQPIRNLVIGIETDAQVSGQTGRSTSFSLISSSPGCGNCAPFAFDPAITTGRAQIDWFGTTRARAGYAWDRWLVYATGGLAYGRISIGGTTNSSSFVGANPAWGFTGTATNLGWTAGGGFEMLLNSNWSAKVEYLYVDLGDVTAVGVIPRGGCYGTPGGGSCSGPVSDNGSMSAKSHKFIDNVVRVGVNLRFN